MKVVIVGGGFGGVHAALNLSNRPDFEVVLISANSYFEYHAALYRSATGRSPLEVAIPLEELFDRSKNIRVEKDTITGIDLQKRQLSSASGSLYQYEVLILATGSVTQYFGIPGLAEFSYGVKTVHEALELKRHLHEDLVKGVSEPRHYVVVGGGPTGVELSAELVAYLSKVRRGHQLETPYTIDLVEAADRVLPMMPTGFSKAIEKRLRRLGVRLHLNSPIQSETLEGIKLPHGEIKSHTVVWTAGVANHPLVAKGPFATGKQGRVKVDQFLSAAPNVYVVGDSADTVYSGMAQTALHDANVVTKNLIRVAQGRRAKPYKPQKPIYAIPVGPRWTAVLWGGVRILGYPGWVLRRLADLRLYLKFLSLGKALTTWRYGIVIDESCDICSQHK